MRIILNILAVILLLVGVVWFLQGMNVLLGSVMTGQPQWAVFGIIAFVVGIALLFFSNRRKSSPPESNL
jgi:membrane-bound ClpP family serine protease